MRRAPGDRPVEAADDRPAGQPPGRRATTPPRGERRRRGPRRRPPRRVCVSRDPAAWANRRSSSRYSQTIVTSSPNAAYHSKSLASPAFVPCSMKSKSSVRLSAATPHTKTLNPMPNGVRLTSRNVTSAPNRVNDERHEVERHDAERGEHDDPAEALGDLDDPGPVEHEHHGEHAERRAGGLERRCRLKSCLVVRLEIAPTAKPWPRA